jgi:hypothetical protein
VANTASPLPRNNSAHSKCALVIQHRELKPPNAKTIRRQSRLFSSVTAALLIVDGTASLVEHSGLLPWWMDVMRLNDRTASATPKSKRSILNGLESAILVIHNSFRWRWVLRCTLPIHTRNTWKCNDGPRVEPAHRACRGMSGNGRICCQQRSGANMV